MPQEGARASSHKDVSAPFRGVTKNFNGASHCSAVTVVHMQISSMDFLHYFAGIQISVCYETTHFQWSTAISGQGGCCSSVS